MEPFKIPAVIPNIQDAFAFSQAMNADDPFFELYIVGGAVRDHLYHSFHGDGSEYQVKDIDMACNISEEEILRRLRSPLAQEMGIRVKEKESVDTFGVVFASICGRGPYEIAPFRKDIGSSDGRHPDSTERGSIYDDAMRRDLTINNLYYDIHKQVILDFNADNQGVKDIENKTVRTVGDPFERFNEDKLRVLRLVRFFCRYNAGRIFDFCDQKTLVAISKYRALRQHGISSERIQTEFMLGLSQCLNTEMYLENYRQLSLLETVFPFMYVNKYAIEKIGNLRNPCVILAVLLHSNQNVRVALNELKYPNEVSDQVQFLIDVIDFNIDKILNARQRKIVKVGKNKTQLSEEELLQNQKIVERHYRDLTDLILVVNKSHRLRVQHFRDYEPLVVSGEELMAIGYKKEQIGVQQKLLLKDHYESSFDTFIKEQQ